MEDLMAIDKLNIIEEWLVEAKETLADESISYGELALIDNIYEKVDEFNGGLL